MWCAVPCSDGLRIRANTYAPSSPYAKQKGSCHEVTEGIKRCRLLFISALRRIRTASTPLRGYTTSAPSGHLLLQEKAFCADPAPLANSPQNIPRSTACCFDPLRASPSYTSLSDRHRRSGYFYSLRGALPLAPKGSLDQEYPVGAGLRPFAETVPPAGGQAPALQERFFEYPHIPPGFLRKQFAKPREI